MGKVRGTMCFVIFDFFDSTDLVGGAWGLDVWPRACRLPHRFCFIYLFGLY